MKLYAWLLFFIAFLGLAKTSMAQSLNVNVSRKYTQQIDDLFKKGKLTKLICKHKAHCGGGLAGYYYKGKLVYMELVSGGELGTNFDKFYIKDSILICVQVASEQYAAPTSWEAFYKKHPSKDGNIDLRYLHRTFDVYRFYLQDEKIVLRYRNGKYVGNNSKQEPIFYKDIVACYKTLLQDLGAADK
jgi:hypothetical protein